MSNTIEKVGFVGFGPMGELMARNMFPGAEIEFNDTHDIKVPDGLVATQIEHAGELPFMVDAIVLTVPARAIWKVAKDVIIDPQVKAHWTEEMRAEFDPPLLIDPCSVKMFPQAIIEDIDGCYPELLHCHPLFGPQSASESVDGKTVIVTKKVGEKADGVLEQWEKLGLTIVEMTAKEHDEKMAKIQAVPFALGRLANLLDIAQMVGSGLETTSFEAAMGLAQLDKAHSEELFRTIMEFNPYAHKYMHRIQQEMAQLVHRHAFGKVVLDKLGLT